MANWSDKAPHRRVLSRRALRHSPLKALHRSADRQLPAFDLVVIGHVPVNHDVVAHIRFKDVKVERTILDVGVLQIEGLAPIGGDMDVD